MPQNQVATMNDDPFLEVIADLFGMSHEGAIALLSEEDNVALPEDSAPYATPNEAGLPNAIAKKTPAELDAMSQAVKELIDQHKAKPNTYLPLILKTRSGRLIKTFFQEILEWALEKDLDVTEQNKRFHAVLNSRRSFLINDPTLKRELVTWATTVGKEQERIDKVLNSTVLDLIINCKESIMIWLRERDQSLDSQQWQALQDKRIKKIIWSRASNSLLKDNPELLSLVQVWLTKNETGTERNRAKKYADAHSKKQSKGNKQSKHQTAEVSHESVFEIEEEEAADETYSSPSSLPNHLPFFGVLSDLFVPSHEDAQNKIPQKPTAEIGKMSQVIKKVIDPTDVPSILKTHSSRLIKASSKAIVEWVLEKEIDVTEKNNRFYAALRSCFNAINKDSIFMNEFATWATEKVNVSVEEKNNRFHAVLNSGCSPLIQHPTLISELVIWALEKEIDVTEKNKRLYSVLHARCNALFNYQTLISELTIWVTENVNDEEKDKRIHAVLGTQCGPLIQQPTLKCELVTWATVVGREQERIVRVLGSHCSDLIINCKESIMIWLRERNQSLDPLKWQALQDKRIKTIISSRSANQLQKNNPELQSLVQAWLTKNNSGKQNGSVKRVANTQSKNQSKEKKRRKHQEAEVTHNAAFEVADEELTDNDCVPPSAIERDETNLYGEQTSQVSDPITEETTQVIIPLSTNSSTFWSQPPVTPPLQFNYNELIALKCRELELTFDSWVKFQLNTLSLQFNEMVNLIFCMPNEQRNKIGKDILIIKTRIDELQTYGNYYCYSYNVLVKEQLEVFIKNIKNQTSEAIVHNNLHVPTSPVTVYGNNKPGT